MIKNVVIMVLKILRSLSKKYRINSQNYSKLDENGIIKVGSIVKKNDVLIGKTYVNTSKNKKDIEIKDTLVLLQNLMKKELLIEIFNTTTYKWL